jgi:hypothetical protein
MHPKFCSETYKVRAHLKNEEINESMILKCISEKEAVKSALDSSVSG